jgi:hypothetical protein
MPQALLGLPAILLLAWLFSSDRTKPPWRLIFSGLAAQLILAVTFLKLPVLQSALMHINDLVLTLEAATQRGTTMLFGYLGGGPPPFDLSTPQNNFVLAFRALLWHWRIIPILIKTQAKLLDKSMGWFRQLRRPRYYDWRDDSLVPRAQRRYFAPDAALTVVGLAGDLHDGLYCRPGTLSLTHRKLVSQTAKGRVNQ